MGKLEKRLEELRNKDKVEEPSKYDLDQQELIKNQKLFTDGQEKLVDGLNRLITDLQNNANAINSTLENLSGSISQIKLDVDLSEVYQGIDLVRDTISGIEPVDLSGLEKSIKNIKPTNLTNLTKKLDDLLISVQGIDIPESKDIDLTSIIMELNKTKTVEFKVVSNSHGFPLKVIAEEHGPTIN